MVNHLQPEDEQRAMTKWRDKAKCKGMDISLFFPNKGERPRVALATCELCPVKRECAAEANNDKRNIQGVWGGLTHRERIKPGYRENLKRNPKNRQTKTGSKMA
jgi:WhiB family redox-sensing transcriptional regulator